MKYFLLSLISVTLIFTGCSSDNTKDYGLNPSESYFISDDPDIILTADIKFDKNIIVPLAKIDGCKYIVTGVIEFIQDGAVIAIVDYGNGVCDDIAIKTVDGESSEFNLDKSDKSSELEKIVVEPLVKITGCDFIVSGSIEYFKNDEFLAEIDYGSGECDEWATKSWTGGSIEFSLIDKK